MLVGELRRARPDRIDGVEAGAVAAGLHDERPQVDVRAVDVRGPRDDELRLRELLGLSTVAEADGSGQTGQSRGGADGTVQPRRAEAMEKPAVHAGAVEQPHGARVTVRQDRFRAEFIGNGLEAARNGIESLLDRKSTRLDS